MAAWVFFAIWFTVTCFRSFGSLNENDETQKPKKNLFLFMGIFFGVWIISLPIIEYVGILLAPWVRLLFAKVFCLVLPSGPCLVVHRGGVFQEQCQAYPVCGRV